VSSAATFCESCTFIWHPKVRMWKRRAGMRGTLPDGGGPGRRSDFVSNLDRESHHIDFINDFIDLTEVPIRRVAE
jgi:hypothetical protein